MFSIKEINYTDFLLEEFSFKIGDYATYNRYYKIELTLNNSILNIGLQIAFFGIEPQIELFKNNIIIGAGNKVFAYNLSGELLKEYLLEPAFYEFKLADEYILVIGELDVFLLDNLYNKIWSKDLNEIICSCNIDNSTIILEDFNKKIIYLDLLTGNPKIC